MAGSVLAIDRQRAETARPEQNDSRVCAGRVFSEVGEFDIQGQENASLAFSFCCHDQVRLRQQSLVRSRGHVVTEQAQAVLETPRQILIQLQLH